MRERPGPPRLASLRPGRVVAEPPRRPVARPGPTGGSPAARALSRRLSQRRLDHGSTGSRPGAASGSGWPQCRPAPPGANVTKAQVQFPVLPSDSESIVMIMGPKLNLTRMRVTVTVRRGLHGINLPVAAAMKTFTPAGGPSLRLRFNVRPA